MGRPIRIEYSGALYHITSRGNERKDIFLEDEDRIKFLQILKDYHERFGILIHAYVLMENHYHLILETPKGNLLKVMHGVNGGYTNFFNRKYLRIGHLFQGRYRGIIVEKEDYLVPLSRYIHLNPVRAGVVEKPEHYRWSSYRSYIGKTKEEDWVEYSWVLAGFGKNENIARRKYQEYVKQEIDQKEVESPIKNLFGQVILGGDGFIDKIRKMLKGKHLSQEIVERRRLKDYPSVDEIVRFVSNVFGVEEESIWGKGSRAKKARNVALYLAYRHTGLGNEEIGRKFGGIQYSTVSKASARVKQEMGSDKELTKLIEKINSHFKA